MSMNIFIDDMALSSVFESLNDNALYIKNQLGYADYYPGFGWYGTLLDINNTSMYKLNMLVEDNIILTGTPVDVSETVLDLPSGWNWIGYTPQVSYNINDALSNIPDGNAQYIKSQTGFSDYYSGFGWYGAIEDMNPLGGYAINMVDSATLLYPSGGVSWGSGGEIGRASCRERV